MSVQRRAWRQRRARGSAAWRRWEWLTVGISAVVILVVIGVVLLASGGGPPREGDAAPDFALTGSDGRLMSLSQLLQENEAVALVFYRGFF